jgi:hypothetical protein
MHDQINELFNTERCQIFFVLNGFINGNREWRAAIGGPDAPVMRDGWYASTDGYDVPEPDETMGPFQTLDDAQEVARKHGWLD